MSQIVSTTPFQDHWNTLISPAQETRYAMAGLGNYVAALAVAVSTLALSVFLAITFVEFIPFVVAGTVMLSTPAIRICKYFRNQGAEFVKLEDQVKRVRESYTKLKNTGIPHPEAQALCAYQEERANGLYKDYLEAQKIAVEFQEKTPELNDRLQKLRTTAMNAEQAALAGKVFSVFLNVLGKHPEAFEKAITKHGIDLSKPFAKCIKWDNREHSSRVMDLFFGTKNDPIVSFLNDKQSPISYSEVKALLESSSPDGVNVQKMENNLYQAFIENQN